MQHLQLALAGGIYFEKLSFSGSTRLFAVPFFHLLQLDYIHFGTAFLPEKLFLALQIRLKTLDFVAFFNSGI